MGMLTLQRRRFLQGALAVAGCGLVIGCGSLAPAARPTRIQRLGVVVNSPPTAENPAATRQWEALLQGLREHGWVEGQNLVFETRYLQGRPERGADLVAELLGLKVDLLALGDSQAAQAAKRLTDTVPIVLLSVGNVVGQGLVQSLAQPGGNVTGISNATELIAGKHLEILREVLPGLSRLAEVWNPTNPASRTGTEEMQRAAQTVGVQVVSVELARAEDLGGALATMERERAEAARFQITSPVSDHWPQLIELAARRRLPTIAATRRFAEQGGLLSLGSDLADHYRRAAALIDKILRGTKAADVPVEQPTTFELVVNLKTAQALGLTLPQSVLAQATDVIQ